MTDKTYNVLFLCTGNSARSLIAEAVLQRESMGRFKGYSAGSSPKEAPHPYTLDLLKGLNHDTSFARAKSWEEFAGPDAPEMDFVFTVCDQAAAETCPVWPGHPHTAHWGVEDPAAVTGSQQDIMAAFSLTFDQMKARIDALLALDEAPLADLMPKIREIGNLP